MKNEAMSVLMSAPENKEQIKTFTDSIIEGIIEGDLDVMNLAKQVKILKETIKKIEDSDKYKDALINETEKHPEKEVSYHGAVFTVKESGLRYDFKGCNYSEYIDVLEKKKSIENMLKNLSTSMVDPNTGEEIFKAIKRSTTTVTVTLK
jgi:hypothetical protein